MRSIRVSHWPAHIRTPTVAELYGMGCPQRPEPGLRRSPARVHLIEVIRGVSSTLLSITKRARAHGVHCAKYRRWAST